MRLSLLLLTACAAHLSTAQSNLSLTDALAAHANLSSLSTLLKSKAPQLLTQLETYTSAHPITLLAPSNSAFENVVNNPILGPTIASNNVAAIENVLRYHVLPAQQLTSSSLNGTFKFFPTMLTSNNLTNVTGGQRIGGVLQGGEPPEIVFVSGESSRSVVLVEDIMFAGG